METVDRSAEKAFFARATVSSDHPVTFDTESGSKPLDLEGREQRRARFTRLVGGIVATLGVGALLALTRPGPSAAEAAPVTASRPSAAQAIQAQPQQPTPTLPPELGGSTAPPAASATTAVAAAPVSAAPAPSMSSELAAPAVSAPIRKPSPASVAPHPYVRAPQAAAVTPFVPAQNDNRPPPTARFAD